MPPEPDAPVPPGQTTLRRWAIRHGRSLRSVQRYRRQWPGFPEPAGELPAHGRNGGGRGEQLFDEAALDAWLASQPGLAPPERIDPAPLRIDPDQRVTLGRFAALIGKDRKTVTQHRKRPGFPGPGPDGTYEVRELLEYWNMRPGRRLPGAESVQEKPLLSCRCSGPGVHGEVGVEPSSSPPGSSRSKPTWLGCAELMPGI